MADAWQHMRLDRYARAAFDGMHLRDRSVGICLTLDDTDGHYDVQKHIFDGPRCEGGIEPGQLPSKKRAIDMGVPSRKLFAQITAFIRVLRTRDGRKPREKMRRDEDDAFHARVCDGSRMDRCDRRAVGMANQNDRVATDRIEDLRQDVLRFARQIIERPRQRDRTGAAIPRAGIGKNAQTRCCG